MYVCVCKKPPFESVREVVEFAGQHIIVPFSNSQAHRIAEKYDCSKYYVEDINALKELIEKMKKFINRKYEIVEINDIRWYPHVVDNIETLVDDDEIYIEYYNATETDGYYGKLKKINIEINVTDIPFL